MYKIIRQFFLNNYILILFLVFLSNFCIAQNQYFNYLEIDKTVKSNDKWNFVVSPSWKNNYKDTLFVQVGLDLDVTRILGNWRLLGGLGNYYTNNAKSSTFYEFRPWFGVQLFTDISPRFVLSQRLKFESRSLYFQEASKNSESGRMRFNLVLKWKLLKFSHENKSWTLAGTTEWYFLKNKTGERYKDSNQSGVQLYRQFTNSKTLRIAYLVESYYPSSNRLPGNGYTLSFVYYY